MVAYWENIDSDYTGSNFLAPQGNAIFNGLNFYSAAMSKYDYTASMNNGALNGTGSGPITVDSLYGKPLSTSRRATSASACTSPSNAAQLS